MLPELTESDTELTTPFLFLLLSVWGELNFLPLLPKSSILLISSRFTLFMLTGSGASVTRSACFNPRCAGTPAVLDTGADIPLSCTTWTVVKDSVNGDNEGVSVPRDGNEALCLTLTSGMPLVNELCCQRPPVDTPRLPDILGASAYRADSFLFWEFLEDSDEGPSGLWGDSADCVEFLLIWEFLDDFSEGPSDLRGNSTDSDEFLLSWDLLENPAECPSDLREFV